MENCIEWLNLYVIVMSNRGKTVISCTLYINNILCVRVNNIHDKLTW